MTERRQRFNHLIGVDRCRVAFRFGDGSIQTQSFDERTEDQAKSTASANLAPSGWEQPDSIEIFLGRFIAVGSTDCEWQDSRRLAVGVLDGAGGLVWERDSAELIPSSDAGSGQLGLFEGGRP